MNTNGLVSLIKANLSTQTAVYMDFIPEKKSLPAISYSHIANGNIRLQNGNRTGVWDTWRIIIVGNKSKYTSAQAIHSELVKNLDNTSSADFKNSFVIYADKVPMTQDDPTVSYVVDIRTYDRGN